MANDLRIGGLATGMDTQDTINKILKYSRAPLDRLKQKQQKLIWEQEAYRTQNTALTKLQELVFNMKLQTNYMLKKVNSSNQQVATATVDASASNTGYNLTVSKLATVATNASSSPVSVRSAVLGNFVALSDTNSVIIDDTNNQFTIKLDDGTAKTITLTNKTYDGSAGKTLTELAQDIQTQLNSEFTNPPVYVRATADKELQFYTGQKEDGSAHTLVLGAVSGDSTLTNLGFEDQDTTKGLTGSILAETTTLDAPSKFKITVGGATQEITLAAGTYTPDQFATAIQTKLTGLGGDFAKVKVTATNYRQLQFTPTSTDGNPPAIKLESGTVTDLLGKIGFSGGAQSDYPKNGIDVTAGIWNQRDKFINNSFFDGKDQSTSFSFAINGQAFSFNTSKSISDVISAINANSASGVTAMYDEFTDKLILATRKTGNNNEGGQEIQINDPSGFLGSVFNIDPAKEAGGENALVTINGVQTQKKENTFKMNGVTFTLTGTGTTAVNVSSDASAVSDQVQKFVDTYNDVIKGLNDKVTEQRATSGDKYTFYEPLTDEQKKAMSEDEITAWNTKAQEGLLHNSTILRGALQDMRMGLARVVETPQSITGMTLSGAIDLRGNNRITVTYGQQTREIVLDEKTYAAGNYSQLAADVQKKLETAFGTGNIKVDVSGNSLRFTTANVGLTFKNGSMNSGLPALGLNDGATVTASYDRLEQIGITTSSNWMDNGKLEFDKEKFEAALAADPDGVMRLLTNAGNSSAAAEADADATGQSLALDNKQGIFYQFYEVMKKQVKNITNEVGLTGSINSSAVGIQLQDLGKQMDTLQDRLDSQEERLWQQFTQLETMMNYYNSQSTWLAQQLGSTTSS